MLATCFKTETRRTSGGGTGVGSRQRFRVGPPRNVREKWPTCKQQPNWPTNDQQHQQRPNAFRVCVSISARHKYSTWRPSSAVDQLTSCNSVHHERKNVLVFIWLYLLLNNGVKWSQRTQDQRRFVSIWSDSICPSWLSPRTQSLDAERFRVERGQSDPSSIVTPRPHNRSAPDAQDLQRSLGFRISKWTSLYIVHWRSL